MDFFKKIIMLSVHSQRREKCSVAFERKVFFFLV